MKSLTKSIKQNVELNFKDGMSIREAAKKYKISISSAGRIKRSMGKSIPVLKKGPPSKISRVAKRALARNFEVGKLGTLKEGQNYIESSEGVHVAEHSVKRYLAEEGLVRYLKKKKPDLTENDKLARLKFAKEHLHWTVEDWRNVMFSDEVTISRIDTQGSRHYYKKPKDKIIRPHQIKRKRQGGGGKIMVWGSITYYGEGYAARIFGTINSEMILNILQDYVIKGMKYYKMNPKTFLFQQDNARVHTAKVVQDYLKMSKIRTMAWPPNSPDLNIIETIWAYIKHRLYKYLDDAQNIDKIWDRFQDIWNDIPLHFIQNLYDSMPGKMKLVVQNKGSHI